MRVPDAKTLESSMARPKTRDFISELPFELARLILSQLDIQDIFTCSAVCQTWRSHTIAKASLYLPHLLNKYNNITRGQNPIPPKANTGQELLRRFPRLSASSYFSNPISLRDLALRDLHLMKAWKSGVPRRKANLNAPMHHKSAIFSVVIDPVYGLVISGDRTGGVVFWNARTERVVRKLSLAGPGMLDGGFPTLCLAVSAMALKGRHLVVGTWHAAVHIMQRDGEDVPVEDRAFSLVSGFLVPSPVVSILLEGTTCIVGCHGGEVLFHDIGVPISRHGSDQVPAEQVYNPTHILTIQTPGHDQIGHHNFNLSMHYRRPFLFTSSKLVSQLTPRRVDRDNARDLWEYSEREITIKNSSHASSSSSYSPPSSSPPNLPPDNLCMLCPLRDQGDLLVAWPDLSICSLGNFNSSLVWTPKSRVLVEQAHSQSVRCMDTMDGFFITGSFDNTIRLFKDDGTSVCAPFKHRGAVNGLAADPCYFVSVSDDKTVVLWDFTPPLPPWCGDASPSPSSISGWSGSLGDNADLLQLPLARVT